MGLLRLAIQIGSLELLGAVLRFARNIVIARLLGVEDYGIANTYLIVLMLVDAVTTLGFGQFLIRDPEGDRPRVLAVVQALSLLRACLVAGLIAMLAEPIAALVGQPQLVDAYRLLAVIPLITGFIHAERTRRERQLDYSMTTRVECGSIFLSLVLVAPLGLWLADHRLVLVFLAVEFGAKVLIAIALAPGPLRLDWDWAVVRRALRFGWPLMLTGPIVFATMQSDKVIVANRFTAAELGQLTAAITLAATPTMMLGRILGSLFFTALSRARNQGGPVAATLAFAFEAQMVTAAGAAVAIGVLGPAALVVVFGEPFRPAAGLIGLAGVAAALPLLRSGFASFAMSEGRTVEPLLASLPRLAAVALALGVALAGGGVAQVLLAGIAGEFAAVLLALALFARHAPDPTLPPRLRWLLLRCFAVIGGVTALHWADSLTLWSLPVPGPWPVLGLLALLGWLAAGCGELGARVRAQAARRLGRRRG